MPDFSDFSSDELIIAGKLLLQLEEKGIPDFLDGDHINIGFDKKAKFFVYLYDENGNKGVLGNDEYGMDNDNGDRIIGYYMLPDSGIKGTLRAIRKKLPLARTPVPVSDLEYLKEMIITETKGKVPSELKYKFNRYLENTKNEALKLK